MTLAEVSARLRRGLAGTLPGHDGFLALAGYKRQDIEAARASHPPPRESAVLALIYAKGTVPHILLMVRPTYDGVHSGQVAFPGGRKEEKDATLMDTALREFKEETGAPTDGIEIIGALTPVYIPPSRSLVTPYVGIAERLAPVDPDPREVALLVEAPIERLLQKDVLQHRQQFMAIMGREVRIPYFDLAGQVVWGATAMMIAELRDLLLHGEEPA